MEYSFWKIVEKAKAMSGDDWESRPDSLKDVLLLFNPEDIIQFDKEYRQKLYSAYKWDLWGAAYIINGGCSDDGFDYFCDFLISEGQIVFDNAIENPDSLVEIDNAEEVELEEYRYSISKAYEKLTDSEMPVYDAEFPDNPVGQEWDEEQLPKMFPRLAAKYQW